MRKHISKFPMSKIDISDIGDVNVDEKESLNLDKKMMEKNLDDEESTYNYDILQNLNKFDLKLIKGIMRGSGPLIMLWLISKKGQHGYELMTQLHESSPLRDKIKMPSASIIYPKLHQLERKGLIKGTWEHHGKRKLKYYEITPEGLDTLTRIKKFFRNRKTNLYEEFLSDMLSKSSGEE